MIYHTHTVTPVMTDSHEFDDFPEAFAYCRRKDAPVIVRVKGVLWKLFPSGTARAISEYSWPDGVTKEPA